MASFQMGMVEWLRSSYQQSLVYDYPVVARNGKAESSSSLGIVGGSVYRMSVNGNHMSEIAEPWRC